MTDMVLQFIRDQVVDLELEGPVVGFGTARSWPDEGFVDISDYFPGLEFISCDVEPGDDVDIFCDIERSQFPPSSMGTVVCLENLERTRHPWLALDDMCRILKPGGTILVSTSLSKQADNGDEGYWRITSSGLSVLLKHAGFEEVRAWNGGDETGKGESNRPGVFCVATKPASGICQFRSTGAFRVELMDGYRKSAIMKKKECVEYDGTRPRVPVVVPLFGREEETRMVFEQLDRVTENYSIVLVDNGFDDAEFINGLANKAEYVKNDTNVGVIKAINQGIDLCGNEPYIVIMHSDAMIFEEGWLDHIIEFMERRPDVGVVSLIGRHTIREDGSLDLETTVFNQEKFPKSFKPTWRFAEVAAVDGMAFVMRNIGLRLDESLGFMHYYDLDISMQYIEAGYRIYNVGIDSWHLAGFGYDSSRDYESYLAVVGGDDKAYYDEVRERFRRKWQHMLPITRGYQDETYILNRVAELHDIAEEYNNMAGEVHKILKESEARHREIEKATAHIEMVEKVLKESQAHEEQLRVELEKRQAADLANHRVRRNLKKARQFLATEGFVSTARRTGAFAMRKLKRQ